ncbi:MAG: hypothetical protein V8Q27_02925 [Eubacteriales bacterium]
MAGSYWEKEENVQMVHMEYAQCYQAFKGGQADVAALVSPYCFQTDDTMVKVADLEQLGVQLYEEITTTDKAYNNEELRENRSGIPEDLV